MKLLTIKETSEMLKIKMNTLYAWVHFNKIPYIKINGKLCFDYMELEIWIASKRHGAT